jgi:hypothetical protein
MQPQSDSSFQSRKAHAFHYTSEIMNYVHTNGCETGGLDAPRFIQMLPAVGTARQSWLSESTPRALALLCVALILALGVFAVSPGLHRQLHDSHAATTEDQCGVVLFATGVSVPVALMAAVPPAAEWITSVARVVVEVSLEAPRYLLRPERGPPLA